LLAIIKTELDQINLQRDLKILQEWTNDWQIILNALKCKVMHFGKTNTKYKYKNDDVILEEVSVEKDLGVYISNIWIAVTI
jgi:hypothetical protein